MKAPKPRDRGLQINLRVTQEDLDAIDEIRRAISPVPTMAEAVRMALQDYRVRVWEKPRSKR